MNTELDGNESTDVEPRTRRALERILTVTHTDGTPISDDESPTVVSVHSGNSGKERRVDVRESKCTCPDHEHRDSVCYHIRRARYALGVEPVDFRPLALLGFWRVDAPIVFEKRIEIGPSAPVVDGEGINVAGSQRCRPGATQIVKGHLSPAVVAVLLLEALG